MSACQRGQHDELIDEPPIDFRSCVNVDRRCSTCGVLVETVSYTKTEWRRRERGRSNRADERLGHVHRLLTDAVEKERQHG